jgi:membrane protein YqaA with SNARE-associated domain
LDNKAIANIVGALITSVISALILYELLVVGNLIQEMGIIGIFLGSLFSHLTVIGRGFFLPAFLPLSLLYNPLVLGLSAGIGGAIGEITTYWWGLGIGKVLKEKETVSKNVEKYGLLSIFLVALSPLPDTPIILLAGSERFSLLKVLIIEAFGKTILYSIGALAGGIFFSQLSNVFEEFILSIITVVGSVVFCIIFSWNRSRLKIFNFFKRILRK